jgi:hypothetical protein
MAAKKSTARSGILSVIFTSLFAPIVASVVAGVIKDDMTVPNVEEHRPAPQQITARYTLPHVPPATLLPPTSASTQPMRDESGTTR